MPDRAVIFDLDGTLVDTAPDLMRATNHVLEGLGRRPVGLDEVRVFAGHGARAMITRGLAATGGMPDGFDVEPHFRAFIASYAADIAGNSVMFPGVLVLLERLQREGIAMGVCTNKRKSLSLALLDALGMSKYFGSVVGADTLGISKPDPRPFHESVKRLGLRVPNAILVGDSEIDVLTARAANVPVICVSFGYTPRPIAEYGPDRIIGHFDECWQAIQELFEQQES